MIPIAGTVERKIRSAIPIYIAAAVWLLYGLVGKIYTTGGFVLCACLSAAAYGIGSLIFPGRVVTEEKKADTGNEELDRMIAAGRGMLKTVTGANDAIPSETVSRELDRIYAAGTAIYDKLEANPDTANGIRRFMNYYMPTTEKLLKGYLELNALRAPGEKVKEAMARIENSLGMIAGAFEKQLDNMYGSDILDFTTDIKVMETMLKGEGLTEKDTISTLKEEATNVR